MSYSVSSWFVDQASSKVASPLRKFVMRIDGSEMVTDPTFDVGSFGGSSVWSYDTANGIAVVSGDGYMWDGWADPLILPGRTYIGQIDVVSYTGGHINIPYDGNAANVFSASALGTHSHIFTAVQTSSPAMYADGFQGAVDNFSVKLYEWDLSNRVLQWPIFGISWDDIKPVKLTMNLANEDGGLNFLRTQNYNMQNSCYLAMGFTHPTSGDETINLFRGNIQTIQFNKGSLRMTLADKFKKLSERRIGTSNSPVDYTGSNHLVSDIAWYICTSHGGLDSAMGNSGDTNTDINMDSFNAWAAIMSGDTVVVEGRFTGMNVLEALRKIARVTKTAIYQEEDKLNFDRFNLVHSYYYSLTDSEIIDTSVLLDSQRVINTKRVMLGYDVTSRYHQYTVTEVDTASVYSYGIHEDIEKDASLWYVNSQSALNFAQRDVLVEKVPFDQVAAQVPLVGMLMTVGEMVSIDDALVGIVGGTYRVMRRSIDMERGVVNINGDESQVFGGFVLDTSSLDGSDVLI